MIYVIHRCRFVLADASLEIHGDDLSIGFSLVDWPIVAG